MPRRASWSRESVREAASQQDGLITAAQLRDLGVPAATVSWSEQQVGGMFTYVLPGVHAVESPKQLTPRQRLVAAQLYAGPQAAISGASRLRERGVRAAARPAFGPPTAVHALIPHDMRRTSAGFVYVERSRHMPPAFDDGLVRFASIARSALDAARRCSDEDAVRALLFEVVQRGLAAPEALNDERVRGQIRGSRFARLALEQVYAGARSVPEGDLLLVLRRNGLERMLLNAALFTLNDEFIARPDAYDPTSGVCLEVDSREHHFSVASWEATMARHARMTAMGLAVIHVPPSRIWNQGDDVAAEVWAAIRSRAGSRAPRIRVEPVTRTA